MYKSKLFWMCLVLVGMMIPGLVLAQQGAISGKVVDDNTGEPLPGANVLVQGLDIGAATNIEGEFTITGVPVGQRSVIARFIGYKSGIKVINVSAGEVAELNFNLKETVLTLDEVVITGAGVATEKRKLGNTVVSLNAKDIEDAPVTNFSEMIAAREAGVDVLPSGGLVGMGSRIRIRGASSLAMSLEPVVYVDGIRVNNGAGYALSGSGGASRLDDINPDAIERIEILKGAAAATLYGTQASNGIIQIFTKKGQFGKPRFTMQIEQMAISYPSDSYHPNVGFARTAEQAQRMSNVFGHPVSPYELVTKNFSHNILDTGYGQTYSLSVSGGGSGVTYFASGRFQQNDGPLNAQAEDFAINSKSDEVFEPGGANDLIRRAQFSANMNIIPSNKLNFTVSSGYSHVHNELPRNGNNIYGVMSLAMFGKPEHVLDGDGGSINAMGSRAFMTVREATYQEGREDAEHVFVSLGANYKLMQEISLESHFGLDFTTERAQTFRPYRYDVDDFTGANTEGSLWQIKRDRKEWTLDFRANWAHNFTSDIASTLTAGFQGYDQIFNETEGFGTNFPGPGLETLSATNAPTQETDSWFRETINAGWFFQEQLGYKDYLYLTGGIRFDANSSFGADFSTQSYPKVALSFVPSSAFDMSNSFISTLRLRGAIGTSGQQPGFFDHLTTYEPRSSDEGPGIGPDNLGNPKLKPEVSTEIEFGFEAGLLEDKLGLEFTYWNRTVSDALVARQFPFSGGFRDLQLDNIGELKANGLDFTARFSAMKSENLSIDLFANAAYITEEVTDMGGAPYLKVGGSYPRYRNFIFEGFAPGAHLGVKLFTEAVPAAMIELYEEYRVQEGLAALSEAELQEMFSVPDIPMTVASSYDTNGDGIYSEAELLAFFAEERSATSFSPILQPNYYRDPATGKVLHDDLLHYLGKPTPDWSGAFGANFSFMKRFRLNLVFEYRAGDYYVNNLTDAFRQANGFIGRNMPKSASVELALENPASTAAERLTAAKTWVNEILALSPYSGLNTIEKADFVRMREISLAYDVPRNIASKFGLRSATLTLSGRNLLTFTGYSGIDMEQNDVGRSTFGGRDNNFSDGVDAFGYPIPRQFIFKVTAGF